MGVSYCAMQSLLNYHSPFAYSTRAEGWACDYYDIDGVCISTGYSPLNSRNMNDDYKIINEYEKKSNGKSKEEKDSLLFELLEKLKK